MAWAATRELFEQVGLYDGAIIGGGDCFLLAGYTNTVNALSQRCGHSLEHRYHAEVWANQFAHWCGDYAVLHLHSGLIHLWHGIFSNRQYRERQQLLENFDPACDLYAVDSGPWQWRDPQSDLAQSVAQYFYSRREDG